MTSHERVLCRTRWKRSYIFSLHDGVLCAPLEIPLDSLVSLFANCNRVRFFAFELFWLFRRIIVLIHRKSFCVIQSKTFAKGKSEATNFDWTWQQNKIFWNWILCETNYVKSSNMCKKTVCVTHNCLSIEQFPINDRHVMKSIAWMEQLLFKIYRTYLRYKRWERSIKKDVLSVTMLCVWARPVNWYFAYDLNSNFEF